MGKKKNNPFGGKKGRKKNNPYGGKKGSQKSKALTTSSLISAIGGRSAQQARPLSRPSFTSPRRGPAAKPVAAAQPAQPPAAPPPPPPPPTPQFQPQGIGPSAYTQQFDHTKLAQNLKALGQQGGGIGIQGFKDLSSMGHSPYALEEAVRAGAKHGLKIGADLDAYLRSGIDPREGRAQGQAELDAMEASRQAVEDQTAQALADADALRAQMEDQFRREQMAAKERAEAQAEARRMQMIRERGAGKAANLQIRGAATGPRGRGGSTGFRRRSDQFRIGPTFKGLSGIETASNLVNI